MLYIKRINAIKYLITINNTIYIKGNLARFRHSKGYFKKQKDISFSSYT